jgi:predicted ATPase
MKLTFETFRDCLAAIDILDSERPAGAMLQPFVIVHGVRSFRKWTAVPLSQINIVTGPNSSGKSTLLEIIASLNRKDFRNTIEEFAGATSTPTHIGFSFDLREAAATDEFPYHAF